MEQIGHTTGGVVLWCSIETRTKEIEGSGGGSWYGDDKSIDSGARGCCLFDLVGKKSTTGGVFLTARRKKKKKKEKGGVEIEISEANEIPFIKF